jgi:hypothetical protein
MRRKDTEQNVSETERTETVRHVHRRITVHGARDLADAHRILAEHGITLDSNARPRTGDNRH